MDEPPTKNGTAFTIRRAKVQDAEGIHHAHMRSIQELCSKDHSPEEIKAWGHRPFREDQRTGSINNDFVWVVENGGSIEGFGHFKILEKDGEKRGHILGLYLTPAATGKSLGKTIVQMMFDEAKSIGLKQITLESTITAHTFYQNMGFKGSGPQITLKIGATPIRCFPMRMEL